MAIDNSPEGGGTGDPQSPSRVISTPDAPDAIGPYSQAIHAAGLVFCSGQIALDPATGEMLDGTPTEQTRRVMANLSAVLAAAGCGLGDVVKTTIYLTDLGAFAEVNAAYGEYFPGEPPARATVEVSALPKGAAVEIDAVALVPSR